MVGIAMAAGGFRLLRRFDAPQRSVHLLEGGKPVPPLAGPIVSGSALGIVAGYVALVGGLSAAVVGARIIATSRAPGFLSIVIGAPS